MVSEAALAVKVSQFARASQDLVTVEMRSNEAEAQAEAREQLLKIEMSRRVKVSMCDLGVNGQEHVKL